MAANTWKKNAVIGIDIGTNDSIAAYVGKAMVDIVQNEVSNRKTPTIIGFDDRERLLGDTAQTKIKSNLKNTIRNFRHLMGPANMCESDIEREKQWQLAESTTETEDGSLGWNVNYKGEQRTFTSTQVFGMYLTKMREVSEAWCQARVNDVVVSCPSYFNDFQRKAIIDAASISGLHCLRVMNEHTATALAYGIYRTKDFDAETPTITAFGHMGHSNFSISIVSFTSTKLQVLAEVSDRTCAGRDMDMELVKFFSEQFNKKFGCNPLTNKKAKLKLEDAVQKCKKILSANDEAPIGVECLMEDEDFSSKITRQEFEEMCAPLKAKMAAAVDKCIEKAGVPVENIQYVEIVGGASRVPWFKETMSEKFIDKPLSTTLNADECVARGCALMAAILSPLYKVRDFKVEDKCGHSVEITWQGTAADNAGKEDEEGDAEMADGEKAASQANGEVSEESSVKHMEVFSAGVDKMDVKKYITWYRTGPFELGAGYTGHENKTMLGRYQIELPPAEEKKKVKIEARMNIHGIFKVDQAVLCEVEEYEETVREKREVSVEEQEQREAAKKAEEEAKKAEGGEETKADAEMPDAAAGSQEKEKEEKKPISEWVDVKKKEEKKPISEWVDVKKTKKRKKNTVLPVVASGRDLEVDTKILSKFEDAETKLQSDSRDVKENDAKRNELESYVYAMREKIVNDGGAVSAYMKAAERTAFGEQLMKGEDWLYDNYEASTAELCEKLSELQAVGNPPMKRFQDRQDVKEYLPNFQKTIRDCRSLAQNPSADYEHIEYENKQKVVCNAEELEQWWVKTDIAENAKDLSEEPGVRVADLVAKEKELRKLCTEVMSVPKPKPAPVEENKEGDNAGTDGAANGDAPMETEKPEGEATGGDAAPETPATPAENMDVD